VRSDTSVLEQCHGADLGLNIKEFKRKVTFTKCLSAQQEVLSKTGVADAVSLHLTFSVASNNKRWQTSVLHPQSLNTVIFGKFREKQ